MNNPYQQGGQGNNPYQQSGQGNNYQQQQGGRGYPNYSPQEQRQYQQVSHRSPIHSFIYNYTQIPSTLTLTRTGIGTNPQTSPTLHLAKVSQQQQQGHQR